LISEVRIFHGLASFYRCFIKDFSILVVPLNEVVKTSIVFKWAEEQKMTFAILKEKFCSALVLTLPDFTKAFEIECDGIVKGI
jgi:hypothetical protein